MRGLQYFPVTIHCCAGRARLNLSWGSNEEIHLLFSPTYNAVLFVIEKTRSMALRCETQHHTDNVSLSVVNVILFWNTIRNVDVFHFIMLCSEILRFLHLRNSSALHLKRKMNVLTVLRLEIRNKLLVTVRNLSWNDSNNKKNKQFKHYYILH